MMTHFAPKAEQVIFLCQSGGPSQIDLFDYKAQLLNMHGDELPNSIRNGQRLTTMTNSGPLRIAAPISNFQQYGQSGAWVSDLLPHTAQVVDQICIIKSVHTDAINHDPAITLLQTGVQRTGLPSLGSWASYGLGSMNQDLPTFVVMLSKNTYSLAQPLYHRLWASGFLPSHHQGVKFRASGDAVLFLSDGTSTPQSAKDKLFQSIVDLEEQHYQERLNPEIQTRIHGYELAARLQSSVPDLTDLSRETEDTFNLYGPSSRIPGTHAANCLLARRLVERGVRFVQLYHRGWDHHSQIGLNLPQLCSEVDQGSAALVRDLAQRGLLEKTLVIWGGEFGRTTYAQGALSSFGRDHHPRCFTMWMAGGGIKPGIVYGETDDFSYNIVDKPVHIHDLHATILHLLGFDHTRLTYRNRGRDFRLTDVAGAVVEEIIA